MATKKRMTKDEFPAWFKRHIEKNYPDVSRLQAAKQLGMNHPDHIYDVLHGRRSPPAELLEALDKDREYVTYYVDKEES